MEIINSSYPEGLSLPTSRVVVCDLHFEANDIVKRGEKKYLVDGAVPNIP